MNPKAAGTRRYFYEYLFYKAVEQTKSRTGKPFPISQARYARRLMEQQLAEHSVNLDSANLTVPPVLTAIDDSLSQVMADYEPVYPQKNTQDALYKSSLNEFSAMLGMVQNGKVNTGEIGPRIPISPYDPRWANRKTVKSAGTALTYLLDEDIEQFAEGTPARLHQIQADNMRLYGVTNRGSSFPMGEALTPYDLSGITELSTRMTEEEYNDVANWVIKGAEVTNQIGVSHDRSMFMSPEAVERAAAILDELQNQGVPYKIVRDRFPGQIAAEIDGTKISVRLTDTRPNEAFVGRVYDDGAVIYYTTDYQSSNDDNRNHRYVPTAEEAVQLLRVAQGLPVDRADGRGKVGKQGTHKGISKKRIRGNVGLVDVQDSYYVKSRNARMMRYKDIPADMAAQAPAGSGIYIRHSAFDRGQLSAFFSKAEGGENFLRESVESARANIVSRLNVDYLVAESEAHKDEEGYVPDLSGDSEIAAIQRAYWDVLTGKQDTLLRPGATQEEFDEATDFIAQLDASNEDLIQKSMDMFAKDVVYTGTPEERVRMHASEVPDGMVGTYDLHDVFLDDGTVEVKRFDPSRVAKYMDSEYGAWRNTSDIVAALRVTDIDPEELLGEGYAARRVKDRLVEFDPATARTLDELPDGVQRRMMAVTQDALERTGVNIMRLEIDDNGIISYDAQRLTREGEPLPNANRDVKTGEVIHGQIGQIFDQGEYGEIVTKFASGNNYTMVPGYEARVVAQKPGESLSVEERTRLRGYEQLMAEQIQYRIANDMLVMRSEIGDPTSVNGVYRRLYDERLPEDFLERAEERGLGRGWAGAILGTLSGRVRYSDEMGDTFYQSWRVSKGRGNVDPSNDNFKSALRLTEGRNMVMLSEEGDGYFDPNMTNASRMGTTRYLVEGAVVNPDGSITRSSLDDRAPLMKHPETEFMKFDAWDRRQMISSMLLHATGVTEPQKVMMSDVLKGWTADDGVVVSADFARTNQMLTKDGTMRDLIVGDKVSDLHGNKGVITMVVDTSDEARQELESALADAQNAGDKVRARRAEWGLYAQQLFAGNDGLGLVMSPFSGVSRFNGGTARELMQDVSDAVLPDGTVVKNGVGSSRFIVTNKDVDAVTHFYDDEAFSQGKGRSVSALLSSALTSHGADKVLSEFYGPNGSSVANLREYLISMGMDINPDTTFSPMITAETLAERRLMEMQPLEKNKRGGLNIRNMRNQFSDIISDRGGDMELPFPLRMPSGQLLPESEGGWRFPVLSSHLRTGQELDDGSYAAHDFTNQYMKIYEEACKYRFAQERLEEGGLSDDDKARFEKDLVNSPAAAQDAYSKITKQIEKRQFEGKYNIFKKSLMSVRLMNSGTILWSADPSLDIDQVGISPALAEGFGIEEDDYLTIWRDPTLRDGGVRYMRVAIDDRLTGISIHPAMDKSFDGDFDGDSVGAVPLQTQAAHKQALEKLTVPANLVDIGSKIEYDLDGDVVDLYPMSMQNSLDTKVSQHFKPELAERFNELTLRANEYHADITEGVLRGEKAIAEGRAISDALSDYYREALAPGAESVSLQFGSTKELLESMRHACIDTGAKGSASKMDSYCAYFGADPKTGKDLKVPQFTREDDKGVQLAVTVKTAVGISGAYTQRMIAAMGDGHMTAALEGTYPATQGQMASKHNPKPAMNTYGLLQDDIRMHFRGYKLEAGPDGYSPARDKDGNYVSAKPAEWRQQFEVLYGPAPKGIDVNLNPEVMDEITQALTDPETGLIANLEERDTIKRLGNSSLLHRLSYGGDFDEVLQAAQNSEQLFGGNSGKLFMPYSVRSNMRELEQYERRVERAADPTLPVPGPKLDRFDSRDTLQDSDEHAQLRGASKRSARAQAVRVVRQQSTVNDVQVDADDMSL